MRVIDSMVKTKLVHNTLQKRVILFLIEVSIFNNLLFNACVVHMSQLLNAAWIAMCNSGEEQEKALKVAREDRRGDKGEEILWRGQYWVP